MSLFALNPRIASWQGRRVWLVGASTGIGEALAIALAARGAQVFVSARSRDKLLALASRARIRPLPLDATDPAQLRNACALVTAEGPLDLAVYCAGHYTAQRATGYDLAEMLRHNEVNYIGALNMLDAVIPVFLRQQQGHLSLLGSVAGYRGLPNGLAYGPTKAALIHLAQALHIDLRERGIGVSIVNPGFVATTLTAQNRFRMPALMQPPEAAQAILRGWERGQFEIHFPRRFSLVLKALSLLPFGAYERAIRRITGA